MPSPSDNTTKWKELAEIDYYSLFIKIWLAFNSWYKGHYPSYTNDRDCIDKIKDDSDNRNSFYRKFSNLFNGADRDAINFKENLEGLIFSLNNTSINNPRQYTGRIWFQNALIDKGANVYKNLIKTTRQHNKRKLSSSYITKNESDFFKGLVEIIYQIRNLLFHGQLEPTDYNHKIIKYAYLVLNSILKDL